MSDDVRARVDRLEVSTLVYLPPPEIYEFLVDFPRYAQYSEHLSDVSRSDDDSPTPEYDMTFSWWKLDYTARSKVTAVEPPERVEWTLLEDLDAQGHWRVEAVSDASADENTASRVYFVAEYDPDSASAGVIDLPSLVSLDWVIDAVTPKIKAEAEQVLRRVVRDLEGTTRPVTLEIHETPGGE